MKTLREENFFEPVAIGDPYLLEEPVWLGPDGEPQFSLDGSPKGRPSWSPCDDVILYVGGRETTVGLVEIKATAETSGVDDWPWQTKTTVKAIGGPSLRELGVPHDMVNRRVRWRLTPEQTARARNAFGI